MASDEIECESVISALLRIITSYSHPRAGVHYARHIQDVDVCKSANLTKMKADLSNDLPPASLARILAFNDTREDGFIAHRKFMEARGEHRRILVGMLGLPKWFAYQTEWRWDNMWRGTRIRKY